VPDTKSTVALLVQAADYMMETTLSEDEGTGSQEPPASQEGYGSQEDRNRTKAAGFDAHLVKPVGLDLLIAVLNEARERHEASSSA